MTDQYYAYYGKPGTMKTQTSELLQGKVLALNARHISIETCQKYNYQIGEYKGKVVQIAPYLNKDTTTAAQKLRDSHKQFELIGPKTKGLGFFGQHLFSPDKRFDLIITEGEIDAMSVFEAFTGGSQPVVSLPYGIATAKAVIEQEFEYCNGFRSVILAFDSDLAGKKGVQDVLKINWAPGQVKIADFALKDANELLKEDRHAEIRKSIWNARDYRADGIIKGNQIDKAIFLQKDHFGFALPYKGLNEMLRGLKLGRLYLITAGSGMGKTTFIKELVYYLFTTTDIKIGNIFLEESIRDSGLSFIALDQNTPNYLLSENPHHNSEKKFNESYEKIINNERMFFYDHFGSLDSQSLLNKINFMAVVEKCQVIFLDHISIAISGLESSGEGERKDIDKLMTNLRSLIQRTGCTIVAISHLKRPPNGEAYNEGRHVMLSDLRGSAALEQLSDAVITLEYNQLDIDDNEIKINILKNRVTGILGLADKLVYNTETGRLL